jgi:ornithine cyclodeaminase/alanine dehydrogenase-like protein (mu-crystallin family)
MTAQRQLVYLRESDLEALGITTADAVHAIEDLIHGHADGRVRWAPKASVMPGDGRFMMATLAVCDDPPVMAVKSLLLSPDNDTRGLPRLNSQITLLDGVTGLPLAVMDGNWITGIRTAALSATAAKRLARSDSAVATFIGTGVQARAHLTAFASMYPLTDVRICGRGRANIESLSAMARDLGLSPQVCADGQEAIDGADLIVTSVTFSDGVRPFLDAGRMRPGSFAAITDLAAPWVKESFGQLHRVIIDDLEQETAMESKLADPSAVHGDLPALVLGKVPGRTKAADRTAFVFRGHAIGDLALSALAYRRAMESGSGTRITA